MKKFGKFKVLGLSAAMLLSTFAGNLTALHVSAFTGQLAKVDSVTTSDNVATVKFNDNSVTAKITFLENGIFRYNVDPSGSFAEYATPNSNTHTATIQAQSDTSDVYSKPRVQTKENDTQFEVYVEGGASIIFDKATAKMTIKNAKGDVVLSEKEALTIGSTTKQILNTDEDEYFFGGGTQNGRFTHKGQIINIVNESKWTDGGVASPNPFYWSTDGVGVLRNTFKPGNYDFGKYDATTVTTVHNESEFDAYYFVTEESETTAVAESLINSYYHVTGNPVLLPEYAFYLSHLNCYNRDSWSESTDGRGWTLEDGKKYKESGQAQGYRVPEGAYAETLNNQAPTVDDSNFVGVVDENSYKFSARAVIDGYVDNDMPLGWFLPNDGYGCGYGHNGYYQQRQAGEDTTRRDDALDANLENLANFTEYAEAYGVRSGLWTQSALTADASEGALGFQNLRDFAREVSVGGVSALKTDVAWVGPGYSMSLNSVKDGYTALASSGKRPTLVSLDGWAGFQRYTSIWTGDQTGGNWEYIRFHIPTYIGQSLSGNPNNGSDVDGIFGGSNLITTRDLQFKTFSQTMLDMDGWGSIPKKPHISTDPYISVNRMYLKLKAQLMPYLYTYAIDAVDGLPMIRAMFLEEANDYTLSTATQYQYMYGDNFLVAPIYQDTAADEIGNDIRNNIYLPATSDVWYDYFTGEQYAGGQIVNNFDAPIWKLPLFVKAGSIIPMYEENNNPMAISETNEKGLDRTRRIIEFYPYGSSSFTLKEDDGIGMSYNEDGSKNYGGTVTTDITSVVENDVATLTVNASVGTYEGYDSNRHTTMVVNVSKKPESLKATYGTNVVTLAPVNSQEAFDEAAAKGLPVYFYNEAPNLNKYTPEDEAFATTEITTTPKLYVSFPNTDVQANAQTLVIKGFANEGDIAKDELNANLAAPTNVVSNEEVKTPSSITISWDAVEGASGYQVLVDGNLLNYVGNTTTYTNSDLEYNSTHTYKVRALNNDGYSQYSDEITVTTLEDPFINTPTPVDISWSGEIWGGHYANLAFDKIFQTGDGGFHSNHGGINEELIVKYDRGYHIDYIEYYPRDDAGNGTVKKMAVSHSLDGVHWSEAKEFTFAADATMKTMDFDCGAQYLKFVALDSVGTFFAASEIKVITVDRDKGFAVGSTNGNQEVTDGDYTNMLNYAAGSLKDGANFTDQIQSRYGDINRNDYYDVYDYCFTMFNLEGGKVNNNAVEGTATYASDKTNYVEGDLVTITINAENVKNLAAWGHIMHYNTLLLEFVDCTISEDYEVAGLENLSKDKVYNDGSAYLNVAVVSRSNKAAVQGTGPITTITFKALGDVDLTNPNHIDLSQISLIGGDLVEKVVVTGEKPNEPSGPVETEYAQSDFTITMTNEVLTSDDGTNVQKLIQQQSYNALFDGSKTDRGFEFLWNVESNWINGQMPEHITLPVTMNFKLNTPDVLNKVVVANANKANGYVTAVKAIANYTDGTKEEITIDTEQAEYVFEFEGNKEVASVDVTVLKAISSNGEDTKVMMTLSEIDLIKVEEESQQPTIEVSEYAFNDFNVTMTNEVLTSDDGTNVTKFIQQGTYDGLFNNDKTDRGFEFLWNWEGNWDADGNMPEHIKLPLTINFKLKDADILNKVVVANANRGNGYMSGVKAVANYVDGTKEEITIDSEQAEFVFEFKESKDVESIDVIVLSAIAANGTPCIDMLTISEIDLFKVVKHENVETANKAALQMVYNANKDKEAKDYTADSWAPFKASLDAAKAVLDNEKATQEEVDAAKADLEAKVAALEKASVKANKDALKEAIDAAKKVDTTNKTDDSKAVLASALAAAENVYANEDATQEAVDAAKAALDAAVAGLKDKVAMNFVDVKKGAWFYGSVESAYQKGLMSNTGKGKEYFEPDTPISRGMVATVLYRMAGLPKVEFKATFKDVTNAKLWYATAITWASQNNVVSGYKDGRFGPDDNITRQDLAIMLRNFAKANGLDTNAKVDFSAFKDGNKVVSYAQSAVQFCIDAKLMSGSKKADGVYLNPTDNATRAECAKMFSLLDDAIKANSK